MVNQQWYEHLKRKKEMVAKLKTIRKKIKQGKKLGFSERARAVNKGLLPSKAKKKKNGKTTKKSN